MTRQRQLYLSVLCCFLGPTCNQQTAAQEEPKGSDVLVVAIAGFESDPSPAQINRSAMRGTGNSGMFQLLCDLEKKAYLTKFFNWNGTEAGEFQHKDAPGHEGITSYIRNACDQRKIRSVILIGHSWGGHTMLEVAEQLGRSPRVEVALAFGVDPSSLTRGKRSTELPEAIASLVIFHTQNAFVWGAWKGCERIENVDLGDPANGFKSPNGTSYAAALDIKAHNSVEWNEQVHHDIIQRIEQRVEEDRRKQGGKIEKN